MSRGQVVPTCYFPQWAPMTSDDPGGTRGHRLFPKRPSPERRAWPGLEICPTWRTYKPQRRHIRVGSVLALSLGTYILHIYIHVDACVRARAFVRILQPLWRGCGGWWWATKRGFARADEREKRGRSSRGMARGSSLITSASIGQPPRRRPRGDKWAGGRRVRAGGGGPSERRAERGILWFWRQNKC